MEQQYENIIDYIDSQLLIHILMGKEIEKIVSQLDDNLILIRYEFGYEFPIRTIRLFLRRKPEEYSKSSIHLTVKNLMFDGHGMRKKLKDAGIPKYMKDKTVDGHHYKFESLDENKVQIIFEAFKEYLPK